MDAARRERAEHTANYPYLVRRADMLLKTAVYCAGFCAAFFGKCSIYGEI